MFFLKLWDHALYVLLVRETAHFNMLYPYNEIFVYQGYSINSWNGAINQSVWKDRNIHLMSKLLKRATLTILTNDVNVMFYLEPGNVCYHMFVTFYG